MRRWARRTRWLLLALLCGSAVALAAAVVSKWRPLQDDGLHDPTNPALAQLQQPAEALAALPPDTAGNLVRWVQAIDSGAIDPRTNLFPGTEVRLLDQDIIIAKYGSMPAVKFPHRAHTLWLDCANCHEHLFKSKAGANTFSMQKILDGEQCGLCHGAVSFPLTECNRCHSVSNAALQQAERAERAARAARAASAAAGGAK